MITIVEGPDGVGKTEYANHLSVNEYAGPVIHWGPPTQPDWIEEYILPVSRLLQTTRSVVCDRGFFAEPMWQRIFKRKDSIFRTAEEYDTCARWYQRQGCRVYLLDRDAEGIEATILSRGEGPEDVARALESVQGYKDMAEWIETRWDIPVTILDSDLVHKEVVAWNK